MIDKSFFVIISVNINFRKERGHKMTKKLICALFCAVICMTALFGCAKDDKIPDGMFSSTIEGEPFILYVPDGWSDNCDSGISSAYYGLNVIASARYYTPEDASTTLESFVEAHIDECKKSYDDFSFSRKDSKLGKETPAIRIEYDFDSGSSSKTKAIQYFGEYNGDVIMLSFYCASDTFEEYAEAFEQIRNEFVLREKTEVNEIVTDKKTPDGMKLASGKVQYRFYVPQSWHTNTSDGLSSAYFPESGKPNVSVTTYSPDEDLSAEKYFELCEIEYKKTISGYELVEKSERTVHDRNAFSYTYKAVYGGTELKIMQTVFVYNDLVYSITYTAHADRFDAHIGDVMKMLDEFRLR